MTALLRRARRDDLRAITAIYNEAVALTTATFDLEPVSLANRRKWLRQRTRDFPVVVAEENAKVVGYAALSRWSDKRGYEITAELSLYVAAPHRGQGVGWALAGHILELAKRSALYTIVSRITADNAASLHLHRKLGFSRVGIQRRCGRKFGKILDVIILQKVLK